MSTRHRIGELLFDIAFASPTLEMTQADALRALVVDKLLPVMDQVFDECAGGDVVWQIDALEIDVGNVNETEFASALATNLRIVLGKALQGDDAGASMARGIPRSRADVDMLLAFLDNGILPWQLEGSASNGSAASGAAATAALHESLLQRVLQHGAEVFLPALRASPRRSVQVARLVRQFPVTQLQALLRHLAPADADALIRHVAALQALLQEAVPERTAWSEAMYAAWEDIVVMRLEQPGATPSAATILHAALKRIATQRQHAIGRVARELVQRVAARRGDFPQDEIGRALAASTDGASAEPMTTAPANAPSDDGLPAILSQPRRAAASDSRMQELDATLSALQDMDDARTDAAGHVRGSDNNTDAALMHEKSANVAIVPEDRSGMAYEPPYTVGMVRNRVITALVGGNAGDIYGDWCTFRDSRPELLHSALLHYSGYGEIRGKIASAFPLSLLADMLALLAPQTAELTEHVWSDPQLRVWLDDEGPEGAARWNNWRRNWWRGAIAYLLKTVCAQNKAEAAASGAAPASSSSTFDMTAYLLAAMENAAPEDERLANYVAQLHRLDKEGERSISHEQGKNGDNNSMLIGRHASGTVFLDDRIKTGGTGLEEEIADAGYASLLLQESLQQQQPSPASPSAGRAPLAQLFEAIRGGAQPLQPQTFSVAQLEQLLHEAVREQTFFQAIVDHAGVARDLHAYYVQVLHALAQNRIIDLEAFAAIEGAVSTSKEAPVALSGSAASVGPGEASVTAVQYEAKDIGERDKAQLMDRLAKALMKGDRAPLYADWDVLLHKHAPLLREALQHYGIHEDILERIALSFPESILYDMIALLAPEAASTWELLRDPAIWAAAERESGEQDFAIDLAVTDKALASNVAGHEAEQAEAGEVPESGMPAGFLRWKRKLWQAGLRHVLIQAQEENNPEDVRSEQISLSALSKHVAMDATSERSPGLQAATFFAMLARDVALTEQAWQQRFLANWQRLSGKVQAPASALVGTAAASVAVVPGNDAEDWRKILLHHHLQAAPGEFSLMRLPVQALPQNIPEQVRIDLRQRFAHMKVASARLDMPLAAAELERMVALFIVVHGDAITEQQQTFMQAIVAQAPPMATHGCERYFRSVLHALLHERTLDLEAIAEMSVDIETLPEVDSDASPRAAMEHVAGQVTAGVPGTVAHAAASTKSAVTAGASESRTAAEAVAIEKNQIYIDFLLTPGFGTGSTAAPDGLAEWLQQAIAAGTPALGPVLAKLFVNPSAVGRFMALLPVASFPSWSSWSRLLARAPHSPTQLQRMRRYVGDVSEMFSEFNRQLTATHLARLEWTFLLPYLFAVERSFEPSRFVRELLDFLAHQTGVPISSALTARLRSQMGIAIGAPTPGIAHAATAHVAIASNSVNKGAYKPNEVAHPQASIPPAAEEAASATNLETFVPNAGVVLCWPFLSRVWEALGLTQADAFVDEAAAQRAALLLQFIVYEQTTAPEYQLTLNKLLCGVRAQTPMMCEIEISTAERELVEQMLSAMIAHWKVLGNTSIRGLRETFLQRPGYLSLKEDGWRLRVRTGPFDVLMEKLPWSISTIRYPWMEKLLWVQWM
ncbi:hypothetical protein SAMN04515620_11121 [Collimonas sp. OK607]|uniref:contractile injection system tape measure protein n=1 Tax=Collimonas sp. OK607 TaxID=1798194 RepID=UPI0008ED2591|nr:contractile injection system tape measure protein [Collimonas sp. OK607]SFA98807.1 hypothetical protein SAMN04515620_11121 [Collimonas sp. OK607]